MHHHEKWRCQVSPTLYFYHPWVRDYSWWWHHYLNYHFQADWVVTCSQTGKHIQDCQSDVGLKRKIKHQCYDIILILLVIIQRSVIKKIIMKRSTHALLLTNLLFTKHSACMYIVNWSKTLDKHWTHHYTICTAYHTVAIVYSYIINARLLLLILNGNDSRTQHSSPGTKRLVHHMGNNEHCLIIWDNSCSFWLSHFYMLSIKITPPTNTHRASSMLHCTGKSLFTWFLLVHFQFNAL